MSQESTGKHTRRGFLDILLGGAAAGSLGTVLYPVIRYLTPLQQSGPSGPTRLSDEDIATLDENQFVIIPIAGQRVMVFRDGDNNVRALQARCTHEGCTVQYMPGESLIWCACHNGRFDINGRILSGPPPRPLPKYAVNLADDGSITVGEKTA